MRGAAGAIRWGGAALGSAPVRCARGGGGGAINPARSSAGPLSSPYVCRAALRGVQPVPPRRAFAGNSRAERIADRNRTLGLVGMTVIVATLGASYAAVPLYRLFCQATGYGGTVQQQSEEEVAALVSKVGAHARRPKSRVGQLVNKMAGRDGEETETPLRPLTVSFNADVNNKLQWTFRPLQKTITIVPGESVLAFFRARNLSDKDIIGVSTYNVTPSKMGQYFNKVQCFCFEEQQLDKGEEVDMPVLFYIDPEMADDPSLKDVDHVTLSYTFFLATDYNDLVEQYGVEESGAIRAPIEGGKIAR